MKRTRQQYHRQVAELLESKFPEVVEAMKRAGTTSSGYRPAQG